MPIDPKYDLEGYIREQGRTAEMETDPYGYAVSVIATVLEYALDDGISGAMSKGEFETLEKVAIVLTHEDPSIEIDPRAG